MATSSTAKQQDDKMARFAEGTPSHLIETFMAAIKNHWSLARSAWHHSGHLGHLFFQSVGISPLTLTLYQQQMMGVLNYKALPIEAKHNQAPPLK